MASGVGEASSSKVTPSKIVKLHAGICSDGDDIAIFVGPAQKLFMVSKDLLSGYQYFEAAFKPHFKEGLYNEIYLPDEDHLIFSKIMQYLTTKEYFPRLVDDRKECVEVERKPMFENNWKGWKSPCPGRVTSGNIRSHKALEVHLDVCEEGRSRMDHYKHYEHNFRCWVTSAATHYMFCQEVELYCTADKYGLEELKTLCLEKLWMFPVGPKELAVLAENVLTRIPIQEDEIHYLLTQALNYHRPLYEGRDLTQYKTKSWGGKTCDMHFNPKVDPYAELENFFTREMSPAAVSLYRNLTQLRSQVNQIPNEGRPEEWHHYDEPKKAFDAFLKWCKRENILISVAEEDSYAHNDNCFDGYNFCAAGRGDILRHIFVNEPVKGFVYAYNEYQDWWSFYPYKIIRFFEKRSRKNCDCDGCNEQGDDGRRLRRGKRSRRGGRRRTDDSDPDIGVREVRSLFREPQPEFRVIRAGWH